MRKFGVLCTMVFISILLGGIYGILHDQITYTIAPEYFTKFKYEQFGFEPAWFGGHRQTVAVIGFLATWWMGAFLGIVLGLTALIFENHQSMRSALQKAIMLTICVAIVTGIFGFFYGKYVLAKQGVDWWLPEDLISRTDFITVGSIHNFSYLGGLLGLAAGVFYLIRSERQSGVKASK